METLIVNPVSESQLDVLKKFLKEMHIPFKKKGAKKTTDYPVSEDIPNAETIEAIEEGRREKPFLKPIEDIDAFFESFKNE